VVIFESVTVPLTLKQYWVYPGKVTISANAKPGVLVVPEIVGGIAKFILLAGIACIEPYVVNIV
jgi:hypothetical protein